MMLRSYPRDIPVSHREAAVARWIWTHVVNIFVLDRNLGEEVKLGELNPVLPDCFGTISLSDLAED
jgi:hypothetical protein